jgi:hypothetical protein
MYNRTERDFFVTKTDLSIGSVKTKIYIAKYDLDKVIIPRPDVPKTGTLDFVTFYMSFAKYGTYGTTFFNKKSDRIKTPLFDLTTFRAVEPEDPTSSNSYLYYPRLYVLANSEVSRLDRTKPAYDKIYTLAEVQAYFARHKIIDIDLQNFRYSLLLTNPAIPRILTVTFDMQMPDSRNYNPSLVIEVNCRAYH